jgi:hypothetical protein
VNSELYARAKGVFVRAVELPTGKRGPFIEQECRGDVALRAEVESLLAHHHTETLIASPLSTARLSASDSSARTTAPRRSLFFLIQSAADHLRPHGNIALGVVLAIVMLAAVGAWVHHGTKATLRQILGDKLRGLLDADAAAVELWIEGQKARIREWSSDRAISEAVNKLVQIDATRGDAQQQLKSAPEQTAIRARLEELAQSSVDYLIWDRTQSVVAASAPATEALARTATPLGGKLLSHVFHGETILCVERPAEPLVRGQGTAAEVPWLTILCPLAGDDGRIVAALMVRDIDQTAELERILSYVHTGETGECYAFDRQGVLLSESRFNDDLARIGLLPPGAKGRSATVVSLRDPGGDLTSGYKPQRPLAACPLTNMAARALAGEDGIDLDGYRDYRGVEVIGAWKWLSKYDFGMAIEIDRWEAYSPLKYLDAAFGAILALLAAALATVVASWFSIARLRREVSAARQLGQYTLEELIGEGGMGQVYRARHSLLKRPTAVKVLKPQHSIPEMLARFEQEVQLSSQLTHPNTIEIYDYGRTPDGVFYYAMEYIDGLNLSQVVALAGPLPAARVVYLLRQICGSLREAHAVGLLHRDIKPQNIMLCCRGGEADVVKVLDFGLAKQLRVDDAPDITSASVLVGTPLYMSPERLLDRHAVDERSDVYSVGAVGFKLLTGEDVFSADNSRSLLAQILETPAPRPSERVAVAVPSELDDLILACLAKRADDRPTSAACLLEALDAMTEVGRWSQHQAFQWWQVAGGASQNA